MKKKNRESTPPWQDKRHFDALKTYMGKVVCGNLEEEPIFNLCIKASLAKCYELNMLARSQTKPFEAFFWLPALRGICEDLIVLNFIKGFPANDLDKLTELLMRHDIEVRTDCQHKFFSKARPQQPVLHLKGSPKRIAQIERGMRAIWNRHGWPGLKHGAMPQIRQIAEKQGQDVLSTLYDYLYRLTSGTVHFSFQALARTGWGSSKQQFTFSTKHFFPYYLSFVKVYGAFLYTLYIEFFGQVLQPNKSALRSLDKIRETVLLQPRWPEMVTFEEMNLKPPKEHVGQSLLRHAYSFMQSQEKKSLLG